MFQFLEEKKNKRGPITHTYVNKKQKNCYHFVPSTIFCRTTYFSQFISYILGYGDVLNLKAKNI